MLLHLLLAPAKFCLDAFQRCRAKPLEDDNYDHTFENAFKTQEKNFLNKHRVRKDFRIQEHSSVYPIVFAYHQGSNLGASATIYLNPEIKEIDPRHYQWLIKHQIGCIVGNSDFLIPLWKASAAFVMALVSHSWNQDLTPERSSPPFSFIRYGSLSGAIYLTGELAGIWATDRAYRASIDFALNNTTCEEQLAGRRQYKILSEIFEKKSSATSYSKVALEKIERSLTIVYKVNLAVIDEDASEKRKIVQLTALIKKHQKA